MSVINEELVKKIANLAKLDLDAEETSSFTEQLDKCLGYFEKLKELDTQSVSETAHVFDLYNIWREDKIIPSLESEEALKAAPEVEDQCFKVPRIID